MTELRDIVAPAKNRRAAAIVLDDGLASGSEALIDAFTPTQSATAILRHLQKAVLPNARKEMRAMVWQGVYGSGKSHLGVLVGHLLGKGTGSQAIQGFLGRLANQGESSLRGEIESTFHRADDPDARPYLVVTLYGSPAPTLQNALLEGLHKALDQTKGLDPGAIMPKTEYAAARERLGIILEHYPDYRGKPLSDWNIQCTAFNLEELEEELENVVPEALDAFKAWHPKVSAGADFDPQAFGGKGVIDAYQEASRNLVEHHGYNGIAVIWDEFGYALEHMITQPLREPVKEIFDLQHFVEAVCAPGKAHTLFIALTHRSLREYGASSEAAVAVRQRLETIEGRFTPMRVELKGSESEGYHLLSAMIAPTDEGKQLLTQARAKADELARVCAGMPLFANLASEVGFIVTHCYPLHPVTAAGLFAIASHGVYAQANRTVFTFFDNLDAANESPFFERPVNPAELFAEELIRLPDLFMVYRKEVFDEYPGLADGYRDSVAKVRAGFSNPQHKVDILTLLLLARVLGDDFQPTDTFLAVALHDQETEPARLRQDLEDLQQAGLIWRRDADIPVWELEGEAGTQIGPLIDEESAQLPMLGVAEMLAGDADLRGDLLPQCGIHDLEPSATGIIRSFEVSLREVLDDAVSLSASNERLSAQVLFLLPSSDAQAAHALQRCEDLTAPGVLSYVWIPSRGLADLVVPLRRYKAIGNLLKQPGAGEGIIRRLRSESDKARKTLREALNARLGREALKQTDVTIKRLGDPDEVVSVTSWHGFTDYLYHRVQELYTEEVIVRTMNTNRLYTRDDRKITKIEALLRHILEFDGLSPALRNDLLGEKETSELAALIDGTLGVYTNRLLVERADGWTLKTPDEAEGVVGGLLRLIRDRLTDKRKKVHDLADLRSLLLDPPYGLPVAVMPLFTAVAIRKDASRLKWVNKTGQFSALLWSAFFAYDDHKLRFDTFEPRQRKVLDDVFQVLGLPAPVSNETDERARETVKGLRDYYFTLPGAVKSSPNLPDDASRLFRVLKQPGQDAQEIANTLLQLVRSAADSDQEQEILRELFDAVDRIKDERCAMIRQTIEPFTYDDEQWQRINSSLREEGKESLAVAFNRVKAGEQDGLDRVASEYYGRPLSACSDFEIGTLSRDIEDTLVTAADLHTEPVVPIEPPEPPEPPGVQEVRETPPASDDPEQDFRNEIHALIGQYRPMLPPGHINILVSFLVRAINRSVIADRNDE